MSEKPKQSLQEKTRDELWKLDEEINAELYELENRRNELWTLRFKVEDEIADRDKIELEAKRKRGLDIQKEEPGMFYDYNRTAVEDNEVG